MTRSRFRLIVAALAVFSLLATACFTIIGFKIKKPALSLGQKNQIIVDLGRQSSTNDSTSYAFVLVGVSSALDLNGASKFDVKRNFGGKFESVSHNALRDFLLTGSNCGVGGFVASDAETSFATWRAFRSTVKINSLVGAFGDTNRVKVKVARNGGSNNSYGTFIIFAGNWSDPDNDGVVEAAEVACTSVVAGSIPFRP